MIAARCSCALERAHEQRVHIECIAGVQTIPLPKSGACGRGADAAPPLQLRRIFQIAVGEMTRSCGNNWGCALAAV
jgi:hypothetical protein